MTFILQAYVTQHTSFKYTKVNRCQSWVKKNLLRHAFNQTTFLCITFWVKFQAVISHDVTSLCTVYHRSSCRVHHNKADLRDLIAATGLVILLKLYLFFVFLCFFSDFGIRCVNNRALPLCYARLYPLLKAISQFKLELQSGNVQFG